jgi:hypothetical protein
VRIVTLILAASLLRAESHPSWWTLAEPEATALVGIQWQNLRDSPFAAAIRAGLPDFPDLPLIFESRQILLSSPDTLAILSGNFPVETLHREASAKGLNPSSYRGIELFLSPGKTTLSIAQLTDQVLLVGLRKTLERAIDRSLAERGRRYSPLLSRAARVAQGNDLWVIATQLPDPLANQFVPLEIEAVGFEGGISLRDGLQMGASIDAGSANFASAVAENLRRSLPGMPAIARTMQIKVEQDSVLLSLYVTQDQLEAAMLPGEAPKPVATQPLITKPVEEPEPEGPQVIRIFGLDDGPREIPLPPRKPGQW